VSFCPLVDVDVPILMTRGPFTISPPLRDSGIGHNRPVFARKEVDLNLRAQPLFCGGQVATRQPPITLTLEMLLDLLLAGRIVELGMGSTLIFA
jgi:hypothetical protein